MAEVAEVAEPELVDEGDGIVEPGLVVEPDEEIELDEVPDVEPAYELVPGEPAVLHEAALPYAFRDGGEDDPQLEKALATSLEWPLDADDAGGDPTDLQPAWTWTMTTADPHTGAGASSWDSSWCWASSTSAATS